MLLKSDEGRALRIGMMMRSLDEVDGSAIYMRKLLDAVIAIDSKHTLVLFFREKSQLGRFAEHPRVEEILVEGKRKLVWDQVSVPRAAAKADVDVLFHYKFTIPLVAPMPTVCQQRGTEYWTHPHLYPSPADKVDMYYNRFAIPLYCRSAARVLTISDSLKDELNRLASVPLEKMTTIYAAADERFKPVDESHKVAARARYGIPAEAPFLMVVKGYTRLSETHKALSPRKGVEKVLAAYEIARKKNERLPPLVILGAGVTDRVTPDYVSGFTDPARVITPGLIAHEDMPAMYGLARGLLFPSEYESFGIPLVEAMACGCPIITSTAPACPEVVGDAAILVPPHDIEALSREMARLGSDDALADDLSSRGRRRAAEFSWSKSAKRLLSELERAAADPA